jgi:hypothetical protein
MHKVARSWFPSILQPTVSVVSTVTRTTAKGRMANAKPVVVVVIAHRSSTRPAVVANRLGRNRRPNDENKHVIKHTTYRLPVCDYIVIIFISVPVRLSVDLRYFRFIICNIFYYFIPIVSLPYFFLLKLLFEECQFVR